MKNSTLDLYIKDAHGKVIVAEAIIEGDERWERIGHCNRCGKCCPGCKHLKFVEQDGETIAFCDIYNARPWVCALYPKEPREQLYEGCGYSWVKVENGQ